MAATNWGRYNLPAIWTMLEGENVCTGADRVLAWEGLATSVREQHRQLIKAGDDLAAVWPPEQNDSAKVFLNKISDLASSMDDTLSRAEDTRVGLGGVIEAIGEAQSTVKTLADGRAAVSSDWVPRFIDHAEDEYDTRAQQAMAKAEAAIADHSAQIQAPSLYFIGGHKGDESTDFVADSGSSSGSLGSGAVRTTPVPVVVPHDPVLPDPGGDSGAAGGSDPGTSSGAGSGHDPSLGTGLGLSGVTGLPSAPAPTVGPGSTVGQPIAPAPVAGGLPGAVIGGGPLGFVPGTGTGTGGVGGFGVPIGRPGAPGGRQAVPMRRALPSGAVIGQGDLGAGQRDLGAGRGGPAGQALLGGQGNRRDRGTEGSDASIGAVADERWGTGDGVTPVIEPDTTVVRHDPGPGVLGFDR